MIKYKKIILSVVILIVIGIILIVAVNNFLNNSNNKDINVDFDIVTTFYPVQLIVNNLIQNVNGVNSVNVSQNVGGCIHEYEFTSKDMKTFEEADLIIKNGQSIEEFLDKEYFDNFEIFDSSSNIPNVNVSKHCWMNIDNYISQVMLISEKIIAKDPFNQNQYYDNMDSYISKLLALKQEYNNVSSQTNIAITNDAFKYFANDGIFNISAELLSIHEGNYVASDIASFIDSINATNTKAILIDSETNKENVALIEMLNSNTDAKIFVIDLIVEPTDNLNQYIESMQNNINVLKEAIEYGK